MTIKFYKIIIELLVDLKIPVTETIADESDCLATAGEKCKSQVFLRQVGPEWRFHKTSKDL